MVAARPGDGRTPRRSPLGSGVRSQAGWHVELGHVLGDYVAAVGAHRLDWESSRLRDLYEHAYIIIKHDRLSGEDRELAEEHLKEISQHLGMTSDDEATPDDADTMTKPVPRSMLFSGGDKGTEGTAMTLHWLDTEEMVHVTSSWLIRGRPDREALEAEPALAALMPEIEAAHMELLDTHARELGAVRQREIQRRQDEVVERHVAAHVRGHRGRTAAGGAAPAPARPELSRGPLVAPSPTS
jgi:hypothetical protein